MPSCPYQLLACAGAEVDSRLLDAWHVHLLRLHLDADFIQFPDAIGAARTPANLLGALTNLIVRHAPVILIGVDETGVTHLLLILLPGRVTVLDGRGRDIGWNTRCLWTGGGRSRSCRAATTQHQAEQQRQRRSNPLHDHPSRCVSLKLRMYFITFSQLCKNTTRLLPAVQSLLENIL